MGINDAELVLGMSRHLSAYSVSTSSSAFGEIEFAGQVYEMAWRLRGSSVSSAERVAAIGLAAKIRRRDLENQVLPALESFNWIKLNKNEDGTIHSVEALLPPPMELVEAAPRVLSIVALDSVQWAAIKILRATTLQPLEREAALHAASEYGDEAAENALRHLIKLNLVRQVDAADGRSAVFNPNIWIGDEEVTQAALKVEDAHIRDSIGSLLEEINAHPGIPESSVTSTNKKWIDFAVTHGLVQRSVVQTSDDSEQRFLFSPNLGRDPFGNAPGDVSGHVRQLVGSMVYATTFAKYKLYSPSAFVRRLISDGEAGDASPIGTDYPMLETGGIVRVVPGSREGRFKLQLLQADVAEQALVILKSRDLGADAAATSFSGELRDQRAYSHHETERARVAIDVSNDDEETRRLIAALRETTSKRGLRG